MTTINDIHDLVELLENHPDWAETLRNLILTKELLGLPQTLARALQDWAETNRAITRLETSNTASLASQRVLHGRMGQLAGRDYEQEVERLAPRLLARRLEVQDAIILQRGWTTADPEYAQDLSNICRQALERGDISKDEDDDLFRADLVLQGRCQGIPVYAVIEASVVAGDQDFHRAERRANILSRALSASNTTAVEAIVIADNLQPGVQTEAHQARYISLPFRREEYQAALDAVNAAIEAAEAAASDTKDVRSAY